MTGKRPTTIAEYIEAAPAEGQPHLRTLYGILKSVAPEAQEAIKWGAPFFVEPRFLFSFSAHKAHCNFAPTQAALDAFRQELQGTGPPRTTCRFPMASPCRRRWCDSWPSTVYGLFERARMRPFGSLNSVQRGLPVCT